MVVPSPPFTPGPPMHQGPEMEPLSKETLRRAALEARKAFVRTLSDADRDSILRTKLAYKTRFRQLVQDSGLMRDNLSATEREYAYAVTSRALEDYRRSYLQEVRQFLVDDEQYALLSNYENTEFTAELAKLRSMEVLANTR